MNLLGYTLAGCLTSMCIIIGLCSCSSPQQTLPNSPFTSGQATITLKKGVTTKEEVLNTFGSPNIVTQDSDGNSIWTYQKNASITKSSGGAFNWTVVLLGGSSHNRDIMNSTRTMTIIITFKENKVADFKTLATNF